MKRFLSMLVAVVLVLTMLPVMSFADDFDTENFTGLVLTTGDVEGITVQLYNGYSTEAEDLMTPVYVDGGDRYYEVTAKGHYLCISKPTTGSARYTQYYNIYMSDTEAAKKTVMDVTPGVRQTPAPNWEPSIEVRYFTDEVMSQRFPSDASMWPQYAEVFKTPAFTIARNDHQQTTQDEMEAYITGLDDANDNMYVYNLGKSKMGSYNIPLVIFTTADLSQADTLEKAAALVKADNESSGKLTVHYQAQIHGDETAAGEAALGTITRLDGAYGESLLDTMNIYVIPRLNPYGSSRGKRITWINSSTYLDPNRDFMRLETSETQLRMYAYNLFYPEVVIDGHEWQEGITATGMTQLDLMMCSHSLPTFSQEFQDTALDLAKAAFTQLKSDGINFSWYQDSVGGIGFNTGSSNTAFHGSFHLLIETMGVNQGLQLYERRVAAHTSAQTGLFDYLDANVAEVKKIVQDQRNTIVENGKTYEEDDVVLLDVNSSDHPELHINNFVGQKIYLVNMKNGGRQEISTYKAKYYDVIKRTRPAPTAYVLPAGESFTQGVLDLMDKQGISYEFIPAGSAVQLQQYTGTVTLAELTEEKQVVFPNGAYVFTMNQPYALILAGFMEPDMTDAKMTDVNGKETGGTLVQMGKISATDGVFPIYRYIHDLNEDGFIDLTEDATIPTGLTAVNAAVVGGTGKITGLDATKVYEYKLADAAEYTPVAAGATEIADLPVGNYQVRYAATAEAEAGTAVTLTVGYAFSEFTVYLDSTSGSDDNDGYSAETAVSTISKAQTQLDAIMAYAPEGTTGTIRIVGTYEIATTTRSYKLPTHSYPLLITGGTLKFTNTNSNSQKWMCIGGPTTFDDITIQLGATGSYQFISGEGHKLVIGENVTSLPYTNGDSKTYFGIQGGLGVFDGAKNVDNTDLTIQSGYWQSVYGGGYTSGVTGDVKVVVSGANVSRVTANHNGEVSGNVYMEIENTNVRTEIVAGSTQKDRNVGGDVTLVLKQGITGLNDGIFAAGDTGNIAGKVTVIADGIDLTAVKLYGRGNGTGTFGSLELVLNSGRLADVAENFLTQDGISVKLGCDQTKTVKLPHDIHLDLNGYDMTLLDLNGCDLTLAEQSNEEEGATIGTITVMDSATDDYDVADGVYGTVPADADVEIAPGYMVITEDGKNSLHKFELEMVALVVNTTKRGITYESNFRGDEKVKEQIKEFGVAMRAYNAPNATTIWADPNGLTHVALSGSQWCTGDNDNVLKSVYVEEIISDTQSVAANQTRCAVPVYGRAYVQLNDGTMLFSEAKSFTMREAMEHMDDWWNEPGALTDGNKTALQNFFKEYEDLMKDWDLPNINPVA